MADPFDPFSEARDGDGVAVVTVAGERLVSVLRHRDLKAVARNHETFTSDAPFRVPIPAEEHVRSVRQLPIEVDPPVHREYRQVVRELFSRQAVAKLAPEVEAVLDELLEEACSNDRVEVVRDFALPLQSRSLALLLGRPRDDAEKWITWGTHVFRDRDEAPEGHASDLDRYLDRALDAAIAEPGDDFFGVLATGTFEGRPLTRGEMLGFANLTFAGGRDTVINLVTNGLWYFAEHPAALTSLRGDSGLAETATEEFLRFYSPLTHIGRVVTRDTELQGWPVAAGERIALGFASANRDRSVFARADECVLDRNPNRHLAFGHGAHTCLGAPLARLVMTSLLKRLATRVATLEVLAAEPNVEDLGAYRRQVGFHRLELDFQPA